jgi:hypothetical protein
MSTKQALCHAIDRVLAPYGMVADLSRLMAEYAAAACQWDASSQRVRDGFIGLSSNQSSARLVKELSPRNHVWILSAAPLKEFPRPPSDYKQPSSSTTAGAAAAGTGTAALRQWTIRIDAAFCVCLGIGRPEMRPAEWSPNPTDAHSWACATGSDNAFHKGGFLSCAYLPYGGDPTGSTYTFTADLDSGCVSVRVVRKDVTARYGSMLNNGKEMPLFEGLTDLQHMHAYVSFTEAGATASFVEE